MARMMKQETVTNISQKYANLRDAIANLKDETSALEKGIAAKSLTTDGFRDAQKRILAARNTASENAVYLGNVFGSYLATIGEDSPETLVKVAEAMKSHLPQIVEAINDAKKEVKDKNREKKETELREALREFAAKHGINVDSK